MAKGFFRMQPKGLRLKPGDCKRLQTFKAVNIEVLSEDNKRVIKRFRFTPPTDIATGTKRRFLESGIEQVLENFIASFERDNPNHRYRLVQCNGKFRLVWIPEEKPDAQAEEMKAFVDAARQMAPEDLKRELAGATA